MLHQFLENLNNLFGVDSKTTVPVIITLFVFLATQLLNILANVVKASRKRKTVKRIIKKNLLDFTNSLEKEAKNSAIASNIFSDSSNSSFKIVKGSLPQISVFVEIGYQDLFNTFYKGIYNKFNLSLRMRAMSKLWAIVEDIQEWEEYRKKQLENFNQLNNEQIGLFNKSHKAYIDYIYQLLLGDFQTEIEKKYVIDLGTIHTKWLNSDNHIDQDIVYEQLVKPSDELNKNYVKLTPHLTLHSLSLLQEMDLNYRNRRQLLNAYSNIYAISTNFFIMNLRRLEVIKSILYPTFELSFKRMFKCAKKAKTIRRSSTSLRFISESD